MFSFSISILQDATLADELLKNLVSSGMDFLEKGRFYEAAEYFIEVARLGVHSSFTLEANLYLSQCQEKLVS